MTKDEVMTRLNRLLVRSTIWAGPDILKSNNIIIEFNEKDLKISAVLVAGKCTRVFIDYDSITEIEVIKERDIPRGIQYGLCIKRESEALVVIFEPLIELRR